MSASNPFTAIDAIVAAALTQHAAVAALVSPGQIQIFDRALDIRGNLSEASDVGTRLWIKPLGGEDQFEYSSSSAMFFLDYVVGYGTGTMELEEIRRLAWAVARACGRLFKMKKADGTPLDVTDVSPLVLEAITPGPARTEQDEINDPPEWMEERRIRVMASCPHSALAS
jgi:hypothetical protein